MVVGSPFDGRLIRPSHHGKGKNRFANGIAKAGLEANDLIGYQIGKQIENSKGLDVNFGYATGFLSCEKCESTFFGLPMGLLSFF